MKINPSLEKPTVATFRSTPASPKAGPGASAQAQTVAIEGGRSAAVSVSVSTLARSMEANSAGEMPDVDMGKVQSVRASIADGSYVVNPELIADRLLTNAQEILQRQAT